MQCKTTIVAALDGVCARLARSRATALCLLFALAMSCSGGPAARPDAATDRSGATDGAPPAGDGPADRAPPPTDGPTDRGVPTAPANIIFVLTDDLSWNLVQYMPNVVQMQRDGVTFSNYLVTDSLCCPSRTSMFTGKYAHDTGVFTNTGDDGGYQTYLAKGNDPQTFAVNLHNVQYRTAMMGKFLNGYEPDKHGPAMGWDEWDVAGNGYQGYNYKLNQTGKVVSYGSAEADYLTDVLSGLGNKFVSQPSSQPFVIEIATFAPHSPYTPAPRHKDAFPGLTYPRTPAFGSRPTSSDPAWLQALPALTDPEIKQIDKNFRKRAQSVQAIDEMIGKLQETLKAIGHHRDTYIFFSSDNGYHMGERSQRAGKQTAFDTDIRVPLIVTGPGVPKGVTIDKIAQNIDLCPTFAELAGTAPPPTVNGHSLVALLHGQSAADWRNVALIEHHDAAYDPNDPDVTSDNRQPPTYEALRSADRVYVKYANGETEYHDHKTDPYELTNTAASLSTAQIKLLGDTIEAIKNCHTDAACWAAQHVTTGP